MLRFLLFASAISVAACVSAPREDAGAVISSWARTHYGEGLRGAPQIFYGDFTGDGVADALAWMTYNDGSLHNFGEGVLFRSERGSMVYWRIDDTASGEQPRDVAISPGSIVLTTTVLQDGDARCCPTGAQNWTIETR